MPATVRAAAVAGSWYPGSAAAIEEEVDRYLGQAGKVAAPGRLVGLVCPHAGLRYSGPVAAYAYSLLRGRAAATVVLVGPSHRAAFDGVAVQAEGAWDTPLGRAEVDEAVAQAVLSHGREFVFADAEVHRQEHSLEMQMPFLQRVVSGLRIVPLLMGSQSREEVLGLAEALAGALAGLPSGRDVVLVASSDLSHYQPAPVANRLDAVVVQQVSGFDDAGLLSRLEGHHNVACGGGPIVAVMRASRSLGADTATVLRYADSGDVPGGDKGQVVGYLAAALTASVS
ncbi:MAG TPA: AmmeMemoRadiSam system protein B [Vicinamibacteria bacterium]|nr:AmmeMemoRadiSam system protein B [Vicinamibacteria bacterium]